MNTRTLLQLPYQAARTPFTVMDAQLIQRLPQDSAPRLMFQRVLGSLDEIAGRLLADHHLEQRGSALRDRADKLTRALDLEQEAAARRRTAATTRQEAEREATALYQDAQQRQREGLREAAETEQARKDAATARARAQAENAKKQADAHADATLDAIDADHHQTQAHISARERRATAEPIAELHDAADQRADADNRRADADQLSDLVDAKKNHRKTS